MSWTLTLPWCSIRLTVTPRLTARARRKRGLCACTVYARFGGDLPEDIRRPIWPYGMDRVAADRDCSTCGGTGRVA